MRVLDLDSGVVHQDADGESQAAQGHDIDRLTQPVQQGQRSEDGKRNRDANDQGAAPAPQEEQDHQSGETGRNQRFPHHARDRGADEDGLVGERGNLQFRRNIGQDLRECILDRVDDRQGGGIAVPRDADQYAAPAVGAHDVVLYLEAVADLRHILDVDRRAIYRLDGQVVEVVHRDRAAVDADLVFGAAPSWPCPPAGLGSAGSGRSRRRWARVVWRTTRPGSGPPSRPAVFRRTDRRRTRPVRCRAACG